MGLFNCFGGQEHNSFDYKPIFYDKEQYELRQKFGHVDGTLDKEMKAESYVPGSDIKASRRDGRYQKTVRAGSRAQSIIGLVGLLLVVGVLLYILKFYSLL